MKLHTDSKLSPGPIEQLDFLDCYMSQYLLCNVCCLRHRMNHLTISYVIHRDLENGHTENRLR